MRGEKIPANAWKSNFINDVLLTLLRLHKPLPIKSTPCHVVAQDIRITERAGAHAGALAGSGPCAIHAHVSPEKQTPARAHRHWTPSNVHMMDVSTDYSRCWSPSTTNTLTPFLPQSNNQWCVSAHLKANKGTRQWLCYANLFFFWLHL